MGSDEDQYKLCGHFQRIYNDVRLNVLFKKIVSDTTERFCKSVLN